MSDHRKTITPIPSDAPAATAPNILQFPRSKRVKTIRSHEPQLGFAGRLFRDTRFRAMAQLLRGGATPIQIARELNRRELFGMNDQRLTGDRVRQFLDNVAGTPGLNLNSYMKGPSHDE